MLAERRMNRRTLFDPEHLRIAAEVREEARRRRWHDLSVIMMLAAGLALFVLAQVMLLLLVR